MRTPPSHRRAKNASVASYQYPDHLLQAITDIPSTPGVYIFHGETAKLPLYIGKSINLRSRLLAHFRNHEEAALLKQTQRISHIGTTGEIGALLLEARLIKEQQPLFNKKLRRIRQLCSLRISSTGMPEIVNSQDVNFAVTPHLYGLFCGRHPALEALRGIADEQRLCYTALGLEKARTAGKACFRAQLHQCAGWCMGKESNEEHHQRLLARLDKLRIACWPYAGPIGLVERDVAGQQIHIINNWHYCGTVDSIDKISSMNTAASSFDMDSYCILYKPILNKAVDIMEL